MNLSMNDSNSASAPAEPDAHGQAALLFAESILHCLVERGVLSRGDALDALTSASEIKTEVAEETGESKGRMLQSLGLLDRIKLSFQIIQ